MHIHYNDLYGHALTCGQEIYNFGRSFLGHHYYTLSLSDLKLGAEKKILKEIKHSYYMTYLIYGDALAQEPLPWAS